MRGPVLSLPTCKSGQFVIADQILAWIWQVAFWFLEDAHQASEVVVRAAGQLPFTFTQQADNRRERNAVNIGSRPPYRPLTSTPELLLFLVLVEVDRLLIARERAGRLPTPEGLLRSYVLQILKTVLNHDSFYAAVAVAQVFCGYSGPETLDIYALAARAQRGEATCSHAKRTFRRAIEKRFPGLVHYRADGSAFGVKMRRRTDAEIAIVRHALDATLPPASRSLGPAFGGPIPERISILLSKIPNEMKARYSFLDLARFEKLAADVTDTPPAAAFDDRLQIPDFIPPIDPNPGRPDLDGTEMDIDDLESLKQRIRDDHARRYRRAPGSYCVRVDDIDRAVIDLQRPNCELVLEEGASVVELMCRDDDGNEFAWVTYILTYDDPKRERWEMQLPGIGDLRVIFDYGDDDAVCANFGILHDSPESNAQLSGGSWDERQLAASAVENDSLLMHPANTVRLEVPTGYGKSFAIRGLLLDLISRGLTDRRSLTDRSGFTSQVLASLARILRSSGTEEDERSIAEAWSAIQYRKLMEHGDIDRIKEIDNLVARQAAILCGFLRQTREHGIPLGAIPSIYEPDERLSKILGRIAGIFAITDIVLLPFFGSLLSTFGTPLASLFVTSAALATILAGRMWWKLGWSRRIFRGYYEVEYLIELLQGRDAKSVSVIDWRLLPVARSLARVLGGPVHRQMPKIQNNTIRSNDAGPWVANSLSEKELTSIIREFGAGTKAEKIAREIVRTRPIQSRTALCAMLAEILELPSVVSAALEDSECRHVDIERRF